MSERDTRIDGQGPEAKEAEPHAPAAGAVPLPLPRVSWLETAERPPTSGTSQDPHASRHAGEGPGDVIDRYRLIQEIGSGGFGAVFLAEQREPVARRVALKILKLGMDTRSVIARFEQERQALALMDHPHIAKVLDAGSTASGRPYFVMELVAGEPITTFCDQQGLSVRERLELFVQVCLAVQHAHQKGVIHRDLKPSNVLVAMRDRGPHATVIDFGIAKAIEGSLGDESMHTRIGQFVGTPRYMSPEQSQGSLDVDTRSDVYSLGVLLYELLTGTTPLDAAVVERSPIPEVQRLIREVDPPRPSTRVSSGADTESQVAARRSTESARLVSLLRGELDWIAMKALEKEPERRYDSAGAFAQDVKRFLGGEPVLAAPPSATYRLRKLVQRHRVSVIAAAVVLLALLGGLAGTLWQASVAARERDAAREEAARATALNDFMTQMLTASDPEAQGSRDVTVLELLEKASAKATETLASEPEAEAEARTLLGSTFRSLGKNDEAIAELTRAVELREQDAENDALGLALSLSNLSMALHSRGDYEAALKHHERAIGLAEGAGEAGLETVAGQHFQRAVALQRLSRFEEVERELDASEATFALLPGDHPAQRGLILTERATLAKDHRGDFEEAERLYSEALELLRRSEEPWRVADGLNSLATIKLSRGKLDEAIPLFEESIAISRRVFGDVHPQVAVALENYGSVYLHREPARTLELLGEALAIREEIYGADSFPVARTRFNMGVVATESGDYRRSRELIDSVIPVFRAHTGERSAEVATALLYRGRPTEWLGYLDDALRDYEAALAIADSLGAPGLRLTALFNLTRLHCKRHEAAQARAAAELGRAALDLESEDGKVWVPRFEQSLGFCKPRS